MMSSYYRPVRQTCDCRSSPPTIRCPSALVRPQLTDGDVLHAVLVLRECEEIAGRLDRTAVPTWALQDVGHWRPTVARLRQCAGEADSAYVLVAGSGSIRPDPGSRLVSDHTPALFQRRSRLGEQKCAQVSLGAVEYGYHEVAVNGIPQRGRRCLTPPACG